MSEEFWKQLGELDRARPSLYRQDRLHEFEATLLHLLASAVGLDQEWGARASLVSHYHFVHNEGAALNLLGEQLRVDPQNLEALIGLTEHYHYHQVNRIKSAEVVELALGQATKQQAFVRQVLGIRIRLALEGADFERVSDSFSQLIEYNPSSVGVDVAFERDFLDHIPTGAVNESLIDRYKELLP